MNRIWLLLCYFLVEFMSLMCKAQGKSGQNLGSIVMVSGSNGSKDGANSVSDPPPSADRCRGYFDVMGQWDPPFNCSAGTYLYCCGTCGFRFCCQFRQSRLDQSTCTNYDTPVWLMTGKPPSKKDDPTHDPTKDKTNLIVYIICGVVAIMVLVGIFTKLGLEKAHRPQRENMSRALADVMHPQGPCTGEHLERDGKLVAHTQHYENIQSRPSANNLPHNLGKTLGVKFTTVFALGTDNTTKVSLIGVIPDQRALTLAPQPPSVENEAFILIEQPPSAPLPLAKEKRDASQMNNVGPTMTHPHSYPAPSQLTNPYEQQPPGKELNKYASLKAVVKELGMGYAKKVCVPKREEPLLFSVQKEEEALSSPELEGEGLLPSPVQKREEPMPSPETEGEEPLLSPVQKGEELMPSHELEGEERLPDPAPPPLPEGHALLPASLPPEYTVQSPLTEGPAPLPALGPPSIENPRAEKNHLGLGAEQANNDFYSKRRHLAELAAKGSLPLHPMRMEHEESNPYNPDLTVVKQNGHKNKISKTHTHPLAFSSNTMKGWDPNDTSSRWHTYNNKKHCTVEQVNELHSSCSHHFLPPQPYFVTNSKTEVTV
ncbi:SHSA9 protein, partial [Polyodon spathula]|nr:SHSA9 protein [Polyodon spathula]